MFAQNVAIDKDLSTFLFVDATHDFASPDGKFSRHFEHEECKPVRDACHRLIDVAEYLRGRAHMTLCRSRYPEGLFPDIPSLATDEKGCASIITPEWFDEEILKTHNSVLSAGSAAVDLLQRRPDVVSMGVTPTSCIGISIADVRDKARELMPELAGVRFIVPLDCVGSRISQKDKQQRLVDEWSNDKRTDVIVVRSIDDIRVY